MEMFHSVWTVILLVVFLGIVFWAWSGKRNKAFKEAAQLPLEDDDAPATAYPKENGHG